MERLARELKGFNKEYNDTIVVRDDLVALHDFPDTGRGVIALEEIPRGMILLKIPYQLTITAQSLCEATSDATMKAILKRKDLNMSEEEYLAVFLMFAKAYPDRVSAPFRQHVELLPLVGEGSAALNNTMFWREQELDLITGTRAYAVAMQLKEQVRHDFGNVMANVFMLHPDLFPLGEFTYKTYKWALACVYSRFMDFQHATVGKKQLPNLRLCMPIGDMFNHSEDIEVSHFYSNSQGCCGIINKHVVKKGSQVFINYGNVNNTRALQLYGFIIEKKYDIELFLAMNDADPKFKAISKKLAGIKVLNAQRQLIPFDCNTTPVLLTAEDPLPKVVLEILYIQRGCSDNTARLEALHSLQLGILHMKSKYPDTRQQLDDRAADKLNADRVRIASELVKNELAILNGTLRDISAGIELLGGSPISYEAFQADYAAPQDESDGSDSSSDDEIEGSFAHID